MSQIKLKHNIIGSDLDDQIKNEEDLLAYSCKYITNLDKKVIIKEKEIEPKEVRKRLSEDSTSISQEYNNISGNDIKKINKLSSDDALNKIIGFNEFSKNFIEFQKNQRKMSSPLCYYYYGSEKYLSKTQEAIINLNNSHNFIKKDKFLNNSDKMINKYNYFINKSLNDINNNNDLSINLLCKNENYSSMNNNINKNNLQNNNNENKKNENNNNIKNLSCNIKNKPYNTIQNINIIQNNKIINNNLFLQNNNVPRQIFNINFINLNNFPNNQINQLNNNIGNRKLPDNIEDCFIDDNFNNILNINNLNEQILNIQNPLSKFNPLLFSYNEDQEKSIKNDINKKTSTKSKLSKFRDEKKPFDKRRGDWLCPNCHNLNFAFRIICNRCQLPRPLNFKRH